jgi:hypothetical protein
MAAEVRLDRESKTIRPNRKCMIVEINRGVVFGMILSTKESC